MSTTTPAPQPCCGYNAPHHGPSCPAAPARVFYCPEHDPGATASYDDARVACSVCGRTGYGRRYRTAG